MTNHQSSNLKILLVCILAVLSIACSKFSDALEYFIGTNMWYAPTLAVSNPERLAAELDTLKAHGITNIRIPATGENWEELDAVFEALGSRGMKAVVFLNNSWEWTEDGYRSYLEAAGAGRQPHPATDGYREYMDAMAAFARNSRAVELFQDHVRRVVSRYSNSNAIYSWQICNEPRPFALDYETTEAFVSYIQSTAALIKSLDPSHLVSTGNEGQVGCDGDFPLFERINRCPEVDYITIHIWPYNWSWVSDKGIEKGAPVAIDKIRDYIDRHLAAARRLGKKVVIEEFGYPRDGFSFSNKASTHGRDAVYSYVFSRVLQSAREGDVLLGCNFWAWSGLAGQTPGHDFWQPGDDLCGDPFQEGQGLNGVYLSDSSTVQTVWAYADSIASAVKVTVPVEHDWLFFGRGPVKLKVEVSGPSSAEFSYSIRRDLDLMDQDVEPLFTRSVSVRTRPGKVTRTVLPLGKLAPGFYQIEIEGGKSFNIGVNPELIQSPSDAPEDFDAFWESTLSELSIEPMDVSMTLLPELSSPQRNQYRVEIRSFGGAVMGGLYCEPVAEGSYKTVIDYMGYGADVYPYDPDSKPNTVQFLVSVRDQGIFKDGQSRWIDRGLSSRDDFYYRGAFCDVVRAVDFILTRDKVDRENIFAEGESQGGAFTWIAAALRPDVFRAAAPAVPFLSDYPDYSRIVWWPLWEMFETADAQGLSHEDMFEVLRYFDVKNFTPRIECPVIMAFGLQDPTCPPHTNFAGYNNCTSEKEYFCVPTCGHAMWAEPSWSDARELFFQHHTL